MGTGHLRWASLAAYVLLAASALALLAQGALLADGTVAIFVQLAALALMIWARLVFGRRSFHAGAGPTEGGLMTAGPYRYLRHPIYAGILLFIAASAASHSGSLNWSLMVVAALSIAMRIVAEESLLMARYPEYRDYAARTRRLVPFIF